MQESCCENLHYDCQQARTLILEALDEASLNRDGHVDLIRLRLRYPSTYMRVYALECMERFLAVKRVKHHFVAVQDLQFTDRFYFFDPCVLVKATLRGFAKANEEFARANVVSLSMVEYSMKRQLDLTEEDGVEAKRSKQGA
jgi:hypothetical protein